MTLETAVSPFSRLDDDEPPEIIARDLSVTLVGGKPLYSNLSLTLPAAKTTCLLGQSGIGKSMLLRLVLGLTTPGDGVVSTMSGSLGAADHRAIVGRAAYMGQSDYLLPWLSVHENVTLGARLRGTPSRENRERAEKLLESVGLADVAERYPGTLSGGMRQRVALARTLFEDRPVICMDEPFSKLDAITRLKLQDLAARTLAGRTVLLVTHDPLEALRLGHRVVVLGGEPAGVIEAHDLPGQPARDPANTELLSLQSTLLRNLSGASA